MKPPRKKQDQPQATAPAARRAWGRELLGLLAWALACGLLFAGSLWMVEHDWEHGRARSALMALTGLLCFALRWPWRPLRLFAWRPLAVVAWLLFLGALAVDVRIGVESVQHARKTGEIRLDQGQNLLRAAQLLRRGEDPYGRGALIDLEAFQQRLQLRARLGLAPQMHPAALAQALGRYAREPEIFLRKQLLPEPAPFAPDEAQREFSLLGHKYGPLPVLVAMPLLGAGRAAIPALQLAAFLGWVLALWWTLRAPALRLGAAALPLALTLILLEPHVAHDYLYDSASDAWCLAFCALALGAHLRGRRGLTGAAIALALGCKLFPAALFVPLLLARPLRRAFLSCALVLALLYLPFLAWDGRGLWLNLVAWPSLMAPDNTGWLAYAPQVAPLARTGLMLLIAALSALDLFGLRLRVAPPRPRFVPVDPARLPAHFALVSACALLAGSALHNNYVPWVTSWGLIAVALAFASAPVAPEPRAPGGGAANP